MEEKEVLIETADAGGITGRATIIDNNQNIEYINPGRLIEVTPGITRAIAQILSISRGNPPKEDIIGILIRK